MGAQEAQERLVLDVDRAGVLMEMGLTRERFEELLAGIKHEDAYAILAKVVNNSRWPEAVGHFVDKLSRAVSDPAVRSLIGKYGAELEVDDKGGWRLVIYTPLPVAIYYVFDKDSYVAAALGSDGYAVASSHAEFHKSAREALEELGESLGGVARRVRYEAELREWLRDAWPGAELRPDIFISDEVRRRLPEVEETARAIEESLGRQPAQQQPPAQPQEQPREAQRPSQPEQQQQPRGGLARLLARLFGRR